MIQVKARVVSVLTSVQKRKPWRYHLYFEILIGAILLFSRSENAAPSQ